MSDKTKEFGIALLGTGTVGGGVCDLINEHGDLIAKRNGVRLRIVSASARDTAKAKGRIGNCAPVFANWREAIEQPGVDAVVELMGGIEQALECAQLSAERKFPLITANKALLATHGDQLFEQAQRQETGIYFEAAVAGCIPAIRTLRDSLSGDKVRSVLGIVNGTCNYILTRISTDKLSFEQALEAATQEGYAEADPSLDIDGFDAAHKAVIMSWLAFGTPLSMDNIFVAGIRGSSTVDESLAAEFGYVVKLIALAKDVSADQALVQVSPALVDNNHSLAKIDGSRNAILIDSSAAGEMMLVGQGAGPPTASAVMSDLVEAAQQKQSGEKQQLPTANGVQVMPSGDNLTQAYFRIRVLDVAGIIAKVSSALTDLGISIEGIHQGESLEGKPVDIAMLLHECKWQMALNAARQVAEMEETIGDPVLMPIAVPHNR